MNDSGTPAPTGTMHHRSTGVTTALNRRQFLKTGVAAAAPLILPAAASGRGDAAAAGERITIGVIGLGSRGFNLLDAFGQAPDAQIVAVCDVDKLHYRDREWGKGTAYGREPGRRKAETLAGGSLAVTDDYREITGRDDIDAIVVATPDHWHAAITLEAIAAGKDVYCEKPVTHTFREGQLACRAVAESGTVFQTGSQQRSDAKFRRAVELVRNGLLGRIERIEVGLPPGYERPQGDPTVTEPPANLDYEMWTGPAPLLPYMRARHHRWWRGHTAYGGGVLMDWIGHHNDIAHWALNTAGPTKVEAVGWTFPETGVYDTPYEYEIRCEYADGVSSSIASRHRQGVKFYGEDGRLFVSRSKLEASEPRWLAPDFRPGSEQVYRSDDHVRNFLDCVKSRRTCIAPAEVAHRSITPGHLAYVSQALGVPLQWDAATERVADNEQANALLQRHSSRQFDGA